MEQSNIQATVGMRVEANDGYLGTVSDTALQDGGLTYLLVRTEDGRSLLVTAEAISEVTKERVRLHLSGAELRERSGSLSAETLLNLQRGGSLVVPLVAERLVVGKREVSLGELRIIKRVEQEQAEQQVSLTHDNLQVERIAINQPVDPAAIPVSREENGVLIVPVLREVLVVQKQLLLVEEVRISRQQVTEQQTVSDVVRRERIEFEDATNGSVRGLSALNLEAVGGEVNPVQ